MDDRGEGGDGAEGEERADRQLDRHPKTSSPLPMRVTRRGCLPGPREEQAPSRSTRAGTRRVSQPELAAQAMASPQMPNGTLT